MAADHVELIKEGYQAWNSGDRQWVLDHMSPEIEWVAPNEDPEPGSYKGYEGVERFWGQWRAAVGQLHFDLEEIFQSNDDVIVIARRTGKGEHSGLTVSDRVVQVFSFEGEKCVRVREYYDRDQAMRALNPAEVTDEA